MSSVAISELEGWSLRPEELGLMFVSGAASIGIACVVSTSRATDAQKQMSICTVEAIFGRCGTINAYAQRETFNPKP